VEHARLVITDGEVRSPRAAPSAVDQGDDSTGDARSAAPARTGGGHRTYSPRARVAPGGRRGRDRHCDQEHRGPAEGSGEQAADDDPGCPAKPGSSAPDAQMLMARARSVPGKVRRSSDREGPDAFYPADTPQTAKPSSTLIC
jgi:hypothetical protein